MRASIVPSLVLAGALAASPAAAQDAVEERVAAAADGMVLIENAGGQVRVEGWEKNEVAVTGALGSGADRVRLRGGGRKTRVEVEPSLHHGMGRADLLARARALSTEVAPPRDLWPGIEKGIRSSGRSSAWLRGLAAAACLVLALAGVVLTRGEGPALPREAALPGAGVARPASLEQAAIQKLEGDYEAAASALLVELRARQSDLPPETVAQVEESLRTIDGALAQIRAALQQDPSQPGLHLMLAATHRKKVDVLRRVMEIGA